uniref:Putative secreted protein n=1 Tax=Ixodes ricinus TaxID=34613 RepID=A0A6B0TT43_IXORI
MGPFPSSPDAAAALSLVASRLLPSGSTLKTTSSAAQYRSSWIASNVGGVGRVCRAAFLRNIVAEVVRV